MPLLHTASIEFCFLFLLWLSSLIVLQILPMILLAYLIWFLVSNQKKGVQDGKLRTIKRSYGASINGLIHGCITEVFKPLYINGVMAPTYSSCDGAHLIQQLDVAFRRLPVLVWNDCWKLESAYSSLRKRRQMGVTLESYTLES